MSNRLRTLELDVAAYAPSEEMIASAVARVRAKGIRFFTLGDVKDTPETRYKLYELIREGVIDDPSNNGTFMDCEQFSKNLFEAFYWRWADSQFLAACGQDWVGLTNLQLREVEKAVFGVTVVRRAYRRQGIARTLKLLALQHVHELGVRAIRTRNDVANTPILSLNGALGFHQVDC